MENSNNDIFKLAEEIKQFLRACMNEDIEKFSAWRAACRFFVAVKGITVAEFKQAAKEVSDMAKANPEIK